MLWSSWDKVDLADKVNHILLMGWAVDLYLKTTVPTPQRNI